METTKPATYRIKDIDPTDRPRERLAEKGPDVLTSAELLAILLRVGVKGENAVQLGQRLLNDLNGLAGIHKADFQEVCDQKGVGPAKAAQIKAAIELGRRLISQDPEAKKAIHGPGDAADIVKYSMMALDHEELWVLLLDTKNQVISTEKLYKGSLNSSMVRIGELFKAAIQRNAASIIVVHNHPSGDPTPSPEDIYLTKALVQAGKLLDIEVLDHIVIGGSSHVSLKDKNLGFG